jgi:DNA invertase Pin-like site-specific DNA recombinase
MIDLTTTVTQPKIVAVYARVSTKDKGQDTENQLAQLRAFAASQGWVVGGEYIDHASGKNASGRLEFQRLFEDAAQRKFDLVLFWALDRFSREGVLATLQYLQRLSGYGIGYRSFTEGYLDSCGMFKDAVIGILAVVAKQERVRISERVQAGLNRARAAGRVGGRPKGVFDRVKVQQLRQQGRSIAEIAAEVGVPRTSIHRALKQPAPVAAYAAPMLTIQEDVISALVNLGSKRNAAEKAVVACAASSGDGFDALFRASMQTMQKGAAA